MMELIKRIRLRTLLLLAISNISISSASSITDENWNFRVLLDDKEIGYHNFHRRTQNHIQTITSEATFEYKLLFLTLFEYQHDNVELWKGNCLNSIESNTNNNGIQLQVSGQQSDNSFTIESSNGASKLPACVMTFAYWNPQFLDQSKALNSQNGKYVDISVSEPITETLNLNGHRKLARRYDLNAGELDLQLWYSEKNEWLALASEVKGGRILKYQRTGVNL
jgi:hypothetical protein